MSKSRSKTGWQWVLLGLLVLIFGGCSDEAQQKAEDLTKDAAKQGKEMGDKAGEMASQAGDKIKAGAESLGEKAMEFLGPIKDRIGGLDKLKDKPAELKKEVENLISLIESKAESITLPEGIQKTVTTVKEKLVALRDYLGGETKPEEIEAKVDEVQEAASDLK